MVSLEELTIWTLASLTKYIKGKDLGIPVVFMQQMIEKIDPSKDRIEVLYDGPNISRSGSKNEIKGYVGVKLLVYTTMIPSDVYYHTRIKARATDCLFTNIQLLRIGDPKYDKMIMGLLRPIPTETLTITPVSVEEPDASVIEQVFNIELC